MRAGGGGEGEGGGCIIWNVVLSFLFRPWFHQ